MLAMSWYAVASLLAECLHYFLRPEPLGPFSFTLPRLLMYLGGLSFIVFVRFCIALRRHEKGNDSPS